MTYVQTPFVIMPPAVLYAVLVTVKSVNTQDLLKNATIYSTQWELMRVCGKTLLKFFRIQPATFFQ